MLLFSYRRFELSCDLSEITQTEKLLTLDEFYARSARTYPISYERPQSRKPGIPFKTEILVPFYQLFRSHCLTLTVGHNNGADF
jgi:hypothetical protein